MNAYAIALQRAIEHHCRDENIPDEIANDCPHHSRKLNVHRERKEAQIKRLEWTLTAMTEAYENMRAFARAHGLDTTSSPNESNRRDSV